MYIQNQNDQVFSPFIVNCSQVAMFQIMLALCLHGQRERGWSTKCGQTWTGGGGGGVPKIPKFVPTFFMDDPKERQLNSIFLLCLLLYRSVYINLSELDWILFNIAGFVCVVWTDISVVGLGLLYGCTWWWNICENNFGFIDVILFSIHKKLKSLLLFMIIL